ncbi:MAG TPA: hypothetical protein DHV02_07570 [Neisseriales bacterium]|nr:HAD family phosphatase [Burkholderiales bacterium]MBP9768280.1 HAD family phosphatase [Burkholderiales bacterium]HCY39709.1 hypothetical protein [Neisseriales bacterium]
MTIKIIVMDGDGSTITHDHKLPDNLRNLILANPQIKWMMATGRSMDSLQSTPIYQYLSDDIFHIVAGGSCLMYKDGTIHKHYLLKPQEIDLIFNKLKLELSNYLYYYSDGVRGFAYTQNLEIANNLTKKLNNVQITEDINQFRTWLRDYPTGKISLNVKETYDLSELHYHQNENYFDFTSSGVNKGSAFAEMLNFMDLKANEVAFIFNDKNDLPIINHPALRDVIKIKVGDYLPEVKSDYHVATPYDVADILKNITGSMRKSHKFLSVP